MVNFNYLLGEGVINQRVTINSIGVPSPICFSRFLKVMFKIDG